MCKISSGVRFSLGNNIPSDTLKAIATAIQRNIDHHSMYQQHVGMMRSLKDELHHIEHEKQLEVRSFILPY